MKPVDITKRMFELNFWWEFLYLAQPSVLPARTLNLQKQGGLHAVLSDSLRIFSVLLTVWKNVWSDSGFPAFFRSKALGFHFLAIQHCNWNQSIHAILNNWIQLHIQLNFHEYRIHQMVSRNFFNHETKNFSRTWVLLGTYFHVLT